MLADKIIWLLVGPTVGDSGGKPKQQEQTGRHRHKEFDETGRKSKEKEKKQSALLPVKWGEWPADGQKTIDRRNEDKGKAVVVWCSSNEQRFNSQPVEKIADNEWIEHNFF